MATAEKESLLKNLKIKIKNTEDQNSANSKNRYNISGSNEMKEDEKDSSKLSGEENKEIIKLNIASQEKDSKSNHSINSKIIKENPEEVENMPQQESKSSENIENNENKSSHNEGSEKDNSSFLNSKHMNNINVEQNEEEEENEANYNMNRTNPFRTTGKFMQIQPHFTLFNKRIDILREGIYDNTKKCLMHKSSLQMSENLMRERANSIVKDFVDKLYNLREMFISSNTDVANIVKDTKNNIIQLNSMQNKNKTEIKECDYRVNRCERQIGYKLLGKPTYSFMKRAYNTTINQK